MNRLHRILQRLPRTFLAAACFLSLARESSAFDPATGNAPIEVIIPTIVPAIFETSPDASDATLVLRYTTLMTNCWFDAIAPYHPTAVGVYSRLGRRPAAEGADNLRRNTAIFYASRHVLDSLFPARRQDWSDMLTAAGLDPNDSSEDLATAVGIGNVAGRAVVLARERDGMNQLGDEGGRKYNRQPYADYTGYKPVNTAYELKDPSRWQPDIGTAGRGLFGVQQFVTPQLRFTRAYTFADPNPFNAPPPHRSNPRGPLGSKAYKAQADEVLAASAGLTDYQKMAAELFNNKIFSLGFSSLFATIVNGLTLEEFVQYDFCANVAAFDTGIVVWNEKYKYDAVRPFSAIRHIYGDNAVTAWGGPGQGTVNDLPGKQWRSYLATANHPEYPSGSATFCAAHAQASRRFFNSDALGWSVDVPAGSSLIEPGVTPAAPLTLGPWPTWTAFEDECGLSRLWAGVHFPAAIVEGQKLGRQFGDRAYEFVKSHIDGTAP